MALAALIGCAGVACKPPPPPPPPPDCGNGIIEGDEECEGTDFRGATCADGGFPSGVLVCLICRVNYSNCLNCGDGMRNASQGEDCDGADLGGADCPSAAPGSTGGTLACLSDCTFDVSDCAACGDGIRGGPEECDGADLGGGGCVDAGFGGGTLACAADCTFDTSACDPCGNDVLDPGERCDGPDLGTASCTTLGQGWAGGTLACAAATCDAYDTSGCAPPPGCGDGAIGVAEECDGADLAGETCRTHGFGGGTLACFGGCIADTTACWRGTGDFNGDGFADVVAAAWSDDLGGVDAGRVWAYFGGAGAALDAADDGFLTGTSAGANLGRALAAAGDLNGDGYSDVAAGAPGSGGVFLYFGGPGATLDATFDALLAGGAGADFGTSVAGAGDVNGDGFDDLIVGAPGDDTAGTDAGAAFLYLGGPGGFDASSDAELVGPEPGAAFGTVAGAGDVDGDGFDDVIVGASLYDAGGSTFVNYGAAYLYRGGPGPFDTAPDATLVGAMSGDLFGYDVAGAGDVDADGFDDVIVGSWADVASVGEAYLFRGGPGALDATADLVLASPLGAGDAFGHAVDGAGDLNGDGYDDLVVGAFAAGAFSGAAFLFLGGPTGALDATADATYVGSGGEVAGWDVAGPGDVDGDEYADVLVGAYGASSAYLLLGGPGVAIDATPDVTFMEGPAGSGAQFGYAAD